MPLDVLNEGVVSTLKQRPSTEVSLIELGDLVNLYPPVEYIVGGLHMVM